MYKTNTNLFPILLSILAVSTQSHASGSRHLGRCPDLPVQENFSFADYKGIWYEQANYNTKSVEGDQRCVYAKYSLKNDELYIQNHGINNRNNKWNRNNVTVKFSNPNKHEGKLNFTMDLGGTIVNGPYWVLGTDYGTYSVVYTCVNSLLAFHSYSVWFLSRKQEFATIDLQNSFYDKAFSVLRRVKIPTSLIQKANQTHCNV